MLRSAIHAPVILHRHEVWVLIMQEGTAFFPGSQLAGNGLLVSDGPVWRRQRQLSNPAFRTAAVASYGQASRSHRALLTVLVHFMLAPSIACMSVSCCLLTESHQAHLFGTCLAGNGVSDTADAGAGMAAGRQARRLLRLQ